MSDWEVVPESDECPACSSRDAGEEDGQDPSLPGIVAAFSFYCDVCGASKCAISSDRQWMDEVRRQIARFRAESEEAVQLESKPIRLPLEARAWEAGDTALFILTQGMFDPCRHGRLEHKRRPFTGQLISVTCPTMNRRHVFHPLLYDCFTRQTHEPKELVVIDTGKKPSAFFVARMAEDPRVVYRFFPVRRPANSESEECDDPHGDDVVHADKNGLWSLGFKRNVACHLASGSVIAHMDDDDLYSSNYLSYMFEKMMLSARLRSNAGKEREERGRKSSGGESLQPMLVKLAEWHVLDLQDLSFGFLDPRNDKLVPKKEHHRWTYGWGFSYMFTKSAWELKPFPPVGWSEDIDWADGLMALGVSVSLLRLPPSSSKFQSGPGGLCAHSSHPTSLTGGEYVECAVLGEGPIGAVRTGYRVTIPVEFQSLLPILRAIISSPKFKALSRAAIKVAPEEQFKIGLSMKHRLLGRWDRGKDASPEEWDRRRGKGQEKGQRPRNTIAFAPRHRTMPLALTS
mmetsp:Transcript_13366/g.33562  ORF Transcript_13366/g.33562 Transcript_13366/m.33562 type:complete len:515 (+) Transcript_13366:47-1591(+)